MAYYGELLDETYNPDHELVYPMFTRYFNNPLMRKIKDIDKYSMYMSKIQSYLDIEYRYLIVFVLKDDVPVNTEKFLNNLAWKCLQTRTLTDNHNIPVHSYIPKRYSDLDQKITIQEKTQQNYTYNVENLPIKISLLPKNKGLDYSPTGSVTSALETYHTIINFV
jgi:hypothetical protein